MSADKHDEENKTRAAIERHIFALKCKHLFFVGEKELSEKNRLTNRKPLDVDG